MDTPSQEIPLKICRHCSVASRTESETCPSCGRSYERRSFRWRWWYALPIVVLAFAGGYFGLSQLVYDDEDPAGLTLEEARALSDASPPSDLEAVVDGERP